MTEVLTLFTNAYELINSINLEPIIGLPLGMCDLLIGILVLFTICSVIMSGLFGKVVQYIESPTEEEKFYNDVYNYRYHNLVRGTVENQKRHNALANPIQAPPRNYTHEYVRLQFRPSAKVKSVIRHRKRHGES